MNNLLSLKEAYFHLKDPEMHYSLHKFLLKLMNNYEITNESSFLVQPCHPSSISDARISAIFCGTIKFYSTAYIGQVRFTTSSYSRNKCADDSSIVYQTGNEIHFGRIHRIFTVDGGDVLFQIFTLASPTHFICETSNEKFYYDEIEMGMVSSRTTTCIITAHQIIEKCVFYLKPNGYATFIRFPNLVESS